MLSLCKGLNAGLFCLLLYVSLQGCSGLKTPTCATLQEIAENSTQTCETNVTNVDCDTVECSAMTPFGTLNISMRVLPCIDIEVKGRGLVEFGQVLTDSKEFPFMVMNATVMVNVIVALDQPKNANAIEVEITITTSDMSMLMTETLIQNTEIPIDKSQCPTGSAAGLMQGMMSLLALLAVSMTVKLF